ncbi:hypothetical protein ACQ4PT_046405 [Festuca glaucescens]
MEATLEQAALRAPTLEQDQRDAAAFTGNSSRDHGGDAAEATRAPGSAPAVTSRISVQKVCSVVRKFGKFKRNLVEEIGFGGMLKIRMLTRLNLKFSAWLMERVESNELKIDEERILKIQDHDVEKVFGLPCGTRLISPDTPEPSEACIEFLRVSSNLSKGAHSLKAAEAYLLRDDINEDSSKVQIDCFKIAFLVFVVGHLLAPSTKYDYISIDFWAALNDTSRIKEFNWCRYVLEHLIRAVRKLKSDIRNRHKTIHLVGCHVFLQVFYLDNLDLGPLSKTWEGLPRISLFDYESVKKMTEMITNDVGGDTSFAGANVRLLPSSIFKHTHSPINPMLRSSFTETGPEDFSNHLRLKYPSLVGHPLAAILEEHNARIMENISQISNSYQIAMFSFMDQLLGSISENRCCCRALGRTNCLLRSPHAIPGNAHRTPKKRKSQFYSTVTGRAIQQILGKHKKTRGNRTSKYALMVNDEQPLTSQSYIS